jgi:hypothetical protein
MAIVVIQAFSGATLEQYDAVTEQLSLGGKSPAGNLFHVAGMAEDGLRVVEVWESESALHAFLGILGPVTQRMGIPPPEVTIFPAHAILTP